MLDIFVHDLNTGTLFPQSDSNGVFLANASGLEPVMSANGEYLVFARERQTGRIFESFFDLIWRRVDGAGVPVQLLTNSFAGYSLERLAVVSSNGTVVVYVDPERASLRLRDMVAGTNRYLGSLYGGESRRQFSPDEQWVVLFGPQVTRAFNVKPHFLATVVSKLVSNKVVVGMSGDFDGTGATSRSTRVLVKFTDSIFKASETGLKPTWPL